jgi:hypothetical protein
MENVEKTGNDENRSSVENVKVYLGTLDNAERTCGILYDTIYGSNENKAARYIKNEYPASPGHGNERALTCWGFKNAGVSYMENGTEEAEEVDVE